MKEKFILCQYTATGVLYYGFYQEKEKIGTISSVLTPRMSEIRICGNTEQLISKFGMDIPVIPGTKRSISGPAGTTVAELVWTGKGTHVICMDEFTGYISATAEGYEVRCGTEVVCKAELVKNLQGKCTYVKPGYDLTRIYELIMSEKLPEKLKLLIAAFPMLRMENAVCTDEKKEHVLNKKERLDVKIEKLRQMTLEFEERKGADERQKQGRKEKEKNFCRTESLAEYLREKISFFVMESRGIHMEVDFIQKQMSYKHVISPTIATEHFPDGYFEHHSVKLSNRVVWEIKKKLKEFVKNVPMERKLEFLPPGAPRKAYMRCVDVNGNQHYYSTEHVSQSGFSVENTPIHEEYKDLYQFLLSQCVDESEEI